MYVVLNITPSKTYATAANALKAVEKKLGSPNDNIRYVFRVTVLATVDGRFFPMIFGTNEEDGGLQVAIQSGFNVVN